MCLWRAQLHPHAKTGTCGALLGDNLPLGVIAHLREGGASCWQGSTVWEGWGTRDIPRLFSAAAPTDCLRSQRKETIHLMGGLEKGGVLLWN